MSYSDQSGGPYPPRDPRDPNESQYPPPPGEDDGARAYHQRAPSSNSVTLPTISPYDPQYASPNGYPPPPDPRAYRPDPYGPQQGGYPDSRGYQQDYGRGGPQHMAFSQSAPRQRTAIACRYCRRRKIRCSGFEDNPSGKCSNCQRFQQDCIFTPVSSQAQAFVPAHAAYPHMRNMAVGPDGRPRMMYPSQGQQLYGAHGQPLGQIPPAGPPYNEYHVSSPTGSYNGFPDDRPEQSRKRTQPEPHPSILPPPMPGQQSYPRPEGNRRSAVEDDLRLPPVTPNAGAHGTSNHSPASENSSPPTPPAHPGLRPPTEGLPFMSKTTPPPRNSPGDRTDPMALNNIMEKKPETDIDRNMLGRLGRKGQQ